MLNDISETKTAVKVIGLNGQISLGKEYAGKQVLVEEQEPGVWLIRTAKVIPDNELWLHQPQAHQDLEQALRWAGKNKPNESRPQTTFKMLENAQKFKRKPSKAGSK